MADLVKGATPEQIAEFLFDTFGKKRRDRSESKIEKYPAKGIFSKISTKTATINDKEVKFPVIVITDVAGAKGKEIGSISFASIHRFISSGKVQKVAKKGSKYEGMYMNATTPLHEFSSNRSEAETIAFVLGKGYTAEDKKVTLAVVDYDEATDTVNSITSTPEECEKYLVEKDVCFITLS